MRCTLLFEIDLEQTHQEVDLGFGAAEIVFEGERVECQPRQADARGGLSNKLHALGALLVAKEALERTASGPAAIAIHDDGHVLRNPLGLQQGIDGSLFRGELVNAQRASWMQSSSLDAFCPAVRLAPFIPRLS